MHKKYESNVLSYPKILLIQNIIIIKKHPSAHFTDNMAKHCINIVLLFKQTVKLHDCKSVQVLVNYLLPIKPGSVYVPQVGGVKSRPDSRTRRSSR